MMPFGNMGGALAFLLAIISDMSYNEGVRQK